MTKRDPWIDALRALALLGVLIVNVMGYPSAPAYPMQMGAPQPPDAILAITVQSLLIIVVQSKAWPLLSFLFGYSLSEQALKGAPRASAANIANASALRKRYWKLLLLGLIHGTFFYFGDILTLYALLGLLLAGIARVPAKTLRRYWHIAMQCAMTAEVLLVALAFYAYKHSAQITVSGDDFSHVGNIQAFLALNATEYWSVQAYALIGLGPVLLATVTSGIIARRFHLLSRRRSAVQFWRTHLSNAHCVAALLLNTGLGIAAALIHTYYGLSYSIGYIGTLSTAAGIYLVAAGLAVAMRRYHAQPSTPAWALFLAPAGQHTMAMYLSCSVMLAASSIAGVAAYGGTLQRLGGALLAWFMCVTLARAAQQREWRDRITRALGR